MTTLNWEAQRSRRHAVDCSTDFPPRTGSFADQRRFGVYGHHTRKDPRKPISSMCQTREQNHVELKRYADHVMHADFMRKNATQRTELIGILRGLVYRCEQWGKSASTTESTIRRTAIRALELRAH